TPTFTSTLPITATLIKSITTTLTISTTTIPTATLPTATMPTATVSPSTTFTATGLSGQLAQVTSVSNGDTIKVLLNGVAYKVRYIMVSAPSTKQPLFQLATDANRTLVKDKLVYLVKDISDKDSAGNLLRYVYLQDGTFVNAEMVRRGYALLTTFSADVAKEPEIRKAQEEAIKAGLGVWAAQLPTAAPIVAKIEATLRACPNINCAVVGQMAAGQSLKLIARTADKTWYQLDGGAWLTTFVLSDQPASLPVVTPKASSPVIIATPTPTKKP
ncbi:MAG: thermonuclease family protein, partial [Chloroflexi bacterium]|nr:thermonuclease family protein [Chloroflexota bacterium]